MHICGDIQLYTPTYAHVYPFVSGLSFINPGAIVGRNFDVRGGLLFFGRSAAEAQPLALATAAGEVRPLAF